MARRKFTLSAADRAALAGVSCALRKRAGLTMQGVADRFGCSQQQVNKYEKGIDSIPLSYVLLMCDIAGVTFGEFCALLIARGWSDRDRLLRVSGEVGHAGMAAMAAEWAQLTDAERRVVQSVIRSLVSARDRKGDA